MEQFQNIYGFTEEEWNACLKVLTSLKDQPINNPDNQTFSTLVKKISKNAKKQLSDRGKNKDFAVKTIKQSTLHQLLYQSK